MSFFRREHIQRSPLQPKPAPDRVRRSPSQLHSLLFGGTKTSAEIGRKARANDSRGIHAFFEVITYARVLVNKRPFARRVDTAATRATTEKILHHESYFKHWEKKEHSIFRFFMFHSLNFINMKLFFVKLNRWKKTFIIHGKPKPHTVHFVEKKR